MNKKQIVCIILLFLAYAAVCLYPPWSFYYYRRLDLDPQKTTFAGWSFVWNPPHTYKPYVQSGNVWTDAINLKGTVPGDINERVEYIKENYNSLQTIDNSYIPRIDYNIIISELIPLFFLSLILMVSLTRRPGDVPKSP